jgi:hypothetical protein
MADLNPLFGIPPADSAIRAPAAIPGAQPQGLGGFMQGDAFGNMLTAAGISLMSSPRNAPLSNFGQALNNAQTATFRQQQADQEAAAREEEKQRRAELAEYALNIVHPSLRSLAQSQPEVALKLNEQMQPKGVDYGWQVINGQLVRTDSTGNATPMGQFGNQPRPMSQEERAAWGIPASDVTPYFLDEDGTPKALSGGGPLVTVNTGDPGGGELRTALDKKEGESWAGYLAAGAVSGANAADFEVLDELIQIAPQGPITGRLAETFKGFNSAGDAFQSIVKRIAPTLRAPGSGSTSDIEYDGMLRSLPGLSNTPEANRMINEIMKSKAQINVERANVIRMYQTEQIDLATTRQLIGELDSRSIMTPQMHQALVGIGGSSNTGTTSTGLTWTVK